MFNSRELVPFYVGLPFCTQKLLHKLQYCGAQIFSISRASFLCWHILLHYLLIPELGIPPGQINNIPDIGNLIH